MRRRGRHVNVLLAAAVVACHLWLPAAAVAQSRPQPGTPEYAIEQRDEKVKGISVGEPKVYDDALLQQMLEAAEARLAALQLFDQGRLVGAIGAVSGASQQFSSFGLNVQGAPVPGVETTTKLPTEQVKTTTAAGATNSTVETITNLGTQDVKTTQPQFNPPPATAPAPATTLPSSGFSVSSSDILNEMTQLTAEINGLRLLLTGDLSSHFVQTLGGGKIAVMPKLKITLGFPISITSDERYKDAVAVVEVEVEKDREALTNDPPAVTALLPREKTYNVAEITDKSSSIGGGVATQLIGVSASFLHGRRTYYLVQDQDTIAATFTPEAATRTGFRWQFRPVLGRRYVRSGLKQTFVQLGFDVPADAMRGQIGKVTVRTYWRKYDRKRGIAREVIADSFREQRRDFEIPRFPLLPKRIESVFNSRDSLEDLGGGQLLVKIPGRFLPGTNVRIGSTTLAEGPRFKQTYSGVRFTASLSDLATKRSFLVAHDGSEVPLIFPEMPCAERGQALQIIGTPQVTAVDETNSLVTFQVNYPQLVKVTHADWLNPSPALVLVVGNRVFGYPDAPFQKKGDYFSAVVPTALLISDPEVTVQTLFPDKGCSTAAAVAGLPRPYSQAERMVLVAQGKTSKFFLYGQRLGGAIIVTPAGDTVTTSPLGPDSGDTLQLVELDDGQLKAFKHLLIRRPGERSVLVAIPPVEAPKKPDPPKAKERVTVDADEAVILGEGMKGVEGATFNGRDVGFEAVDDKTLRLTGLRAAGLTSSAMTRTVALKFKGEDKPKQVEIEVVNTKVESVTR
ncbi:MAG: hypothetical protein JOZ96_00285 [Acidobacteria bacterium]|nr:hypothetical protein [Acidobacteriota bacterium]